MEKATKMKVKVKQWYKDQQLLIVYPNEQSKETLIVKGNFNDIYPGDQVIIYGTLERNHLIGKYFEAAFYREIHDEFWLAKWLKLKKQFPNNQIAKLVVDKKGIEMIWDDYELLKKTNAIFKYLLSKHVPVETIAKIEQNYQWHWEKIAKDPYQLLIYDSISYDQVQHIIKAFQCDDPPNSKAHYFLENLLKKAFKNGHYYLPKSFLLKELESKGIDIRQLHIKTPLIEKEGKVFLEKYEKIEQDIAKNIQKRLMLPKDTADETRITKWEKDTQFSLAKNQKEAVLMALKENFCIVTGGPGVGKTTTAKCITDLLGEHYSILMVAPTGRAAKRANESTGLPTSTVHRLLEYNGFEFRKNKNNLIQTDVLVIDESSMIDAELLLALLEATPLKTRIIFLGDVDQLPSVGAGQILKDMIESNVVPVTRLTEVFRQAADSPIISLAYAVNSGKLPELNSHEDLHYIQYDKEEDVFQKTIEISEKLYKEHDPFDVQILIPTYKGPVGIDAVNKELQKRLNPTSPSVKVKDYEIRQQDKVIQTKNDYERGIYNGDVGIAVMVSKNKIRVLFQGNDTPIDYTPEQFHELQLSYAVTVHRSQGSEYKFAIIPTVQSYKGMLQKNLLYTAITRAKKKLWMIYQLEALTQAASLESVLERYTNLDEALKKIA